MRLYNSPRVTHDLDLAVRTLDIDEITDLMYEHDSYLVIAVENDSARIQLSAAEAKEWIIDSKSGSITFIALETKPNAPSIPLKDIDITTQVIDSKTYITGWTENQENERKFRKLQSGMQKI